MARKIAKRGQANEIGNKNKNKRENVDKIVWQ